MTASVPPPASQLARPTALLRRVATLRAAAVAVLIVVLIVLPLPMQGYEVNWINLALLAVIGALALNQLMGVAGQVSVGNAAFMAIGATVAAVVAKDAPSVPPLLAVLAGAAAAAVVGAVVGIPALRLRGLYLAAATLALYYIVSYATNQYQADTVGASGWFMPTFTIGGWNLGINQTSWYYLLLIVVALTFLFLRRLTDRSRFGRAWHLLSGHSKAASAMGVDVARLTVQAFVVSSFLIGLEGGLYAYYIGVLDSGDFTLTLSIQYVAMIVIGGWGSMAGAMAGAVLVTLLPLGVETVGSSLPQSGAVGQFVAANVPSLQGLVYGILIVVFLMYQPRGLARLAEVTANRIRQLRHPDRQRAVARSAAPAPAGDVAASTATVTADASIAAAVARATAAVVGASSKQLRADIVPEPPLAPLLAARHLQVSYPGGVFGTHSVSLFVLPGEISLLLGANGAGKSSTLRAISGFTSSEGARLASGRVVLDGKEMTGSPPDKMVARGVVLVPERDKVFADLTVAENLQLSARGGRRRRASGIGPSEAMDLVAGSFPALARLSARRAGVLSGGERQMLAVGRALLLQPRLLIVDELSLGLAPRVVEELMSQMQLINEEHGVTILMAEQNSAAASIAQQAFLIETGVTRWSGPPAEIGTGGELIASYLGTDLASE
jgi:branched-chain amino acid transport system permease protein